MVRKPKEQTYNYAVVGFGKTEQEALLDAESRLEFKVNEKDKYCSRFVQEGPISAGNDLIKYVIKYDLKTDAPRARIEAQKARAKSSSAGPESPFAYTRDLSLDYHLRK